MEAVVRLKEGVSSPSGVTAVNPCEHPEWDRLVAFCGNGSFFHGSAWARVLQETYGHRAFYFCRIEGNRLLSLLPVMEVSSPFTGRRGVSLPFTDLCPSLYAEAGDSADSEEVYQAAIRHGTERGWRYLESRGSEWAGNASAGLAFHGHVVDLQPRPEPMFKRLESSVRRGIRKAEQSGIRVEFDNTPHGMEIYYRLHCQTRRRHGVPPQPKRFFASIARHILATNQGFVAIGYSGQQPVAAAVYLHSARDAIYKFGASDLSFQHLRPNNLVMWEAIKRLGSQGCAQMHMGRTSLANQGLRRFKLGFGAREERIDYLRYDFRKRVFVEGVDRAESWANRVFRLFPASALRLTGQLIYPHLS